MSDWLFPGVAPATRGACGFHPDRGRLRLCGDGNAGDQYPSAVAAGIGARAQRIECGRDVGDHGYLTILAIGQLIVGPLSDRFGRRPVNLIGLGIFIVGTIWCAFAGDLANLLIGRSIQASGACVVAVLSRAIARDLFDGQMLTKVMAMVTIATAAALGFSPLLGGMLDHFFGWRAAFVFVAVFAMAAAAAYAAFVGETNRSARTSMSPIVIALCYLDLIRDVRFLGPARTSALLMGQRFHPAGLLRPRASSAVCRA